MISPETQRLAQLLAEIDRLCAEAAKIREKLDEAAVQPALWPQRGDSTHLFDPPAEAHDLTTSAGDERRN